MTRFALVLSLVGFLAGCDRKAENTFSFCRDFDPSGCITPVTQKVSFPIQKLVTHKTVRDFANSIYFRGDRLAFALKNARSKYDVTFECLHGRYFFDHDTAEKQELEYLELREQNVYGLVMVGSLLEKKYQALKQLPYRPLEPFEVTYTVLCGKDLLAQQKIIVELQ